MKNPLVRKLLISLVTALAVIAGAARLVSDYQNGTAFQPSGANRTLQNNQILFPDSSAVSGLDGNQSSDSSFWASDNAGEEKGPVPGQSDSYLFQQNQQTPAGDNVTNLIIREDPTISGGGTTTGGGYVISDNPADADVVISGGGTGTGEGIGGGSGETADTEPSARPNPTPTPNPAPNPDPTPTPDPTPDSGFAGSAKDPTPDKNNPSDDFFFTTGKYTEDILPTLPGGGTGGQADESVVIRMPLLNPKNLLYTGQSIDPSVIFSALDTYVTGTDGTLYLWDSDALNVYVRIDAVSFDGGESWVSDFPATIPTGAADNTMKIRVCYRLTAKSDEWTERIVDYVVAGNCVYVLKNALTEENATIKAEDILNTDPTAQYLETGDTLPLLRFVSSYLPVREALPSLFPGWRENGKLVPWFYTVSTPGRHVLEPADLVALNPAYTVMLQYVFIDSSYDVSVSHVSGSGKSFSPLQTLTNYTKTGTDSREPVSLSRLQVPKYVQAVNIDDGALLTVDQLILPDTVLYVNTTSDTLRVNQSYSVSEGNPALRAIGGVLMNHAVTQILGIPLGMTSLSVPSTVASVQIPAHNSLQTVTLAGTSLDQLPTITPETVNAGCTFIMDGSLVTDYLTENAAAFSKHPVYVAASDMPDTAYTINNGVIISREGSVRLVIDAPGGNITLPSGTSAVEPGALSQLSGAATIILPSDGSIVSFPAGSLDGSSVGSILCATQQQYDRARADADPAVRVILLGEPIDGYTYYISDDGTTLLSAPSDLVEFTGEVCDDAGACLVITSIAANAFADCTQLKWVTLPETISSVGANAFAGCTALEGVVMQTHDSLTLGEGVFDGCDSLRFIASNAAILSWPESDRFTLTDAKYGANCFGYLFAPDSGVGYSSNWTCVDDLNTYQMLPIGETNRAVFGVDDDGVAYLLLRSGKTMDAAVTLPEQTAIAFNYAFADTLGPETGYTVSFPSGFSSLCIGTFANSMLGGDLHLPDLWSMGHDVFLNCPLLESVYFGSLDGSASPFAGIFTGCNSLRALYFTNTVPPTLTVDYGIPFRFNYELTQEQEAASLRIYLGDDFFPATGDDYLNYLRQWRYPMTGYVETYDTTAYENLWNAIQLEILFDTWEMPTDDEVDEALEQRLLTAENYLRTMLGLEPAGEPIEIYHIRSENNDPMALQPEYTLVKTTPNLTSASLYSSSLGLPNGWTLTHIAPGAFARSKSLQTVSLDSGLATIADSAFAGVQSESLTVVTFSDVPPELTGFTVGTPYSFGVDDSRLHFQLLGFFGGDLQSIYIGQWILPMAGYYDIGQLRAAVTNELSQSGEPTVEEIETEVAIRLMAAENRLRLIFGMEQITSPGDMIGLNAALSTGASTETPGGGNTGAPATPDTPETESLPGFDEENPADQNEEEETYDY